MHIGTSGIVIAENNIALGRTHAPRLRASVASVVPTLLWSEDHESSRAAVTYGRIDNWYEGQSSPDDDSADAGGSYVRGATGGASSNFAHNGTWAMRSRISVTPTASVGVRTNYRVFTEADPLRDLYYGAWYYLPNTVTVGNFWQHMQFKVRDQQAGTAPYVAYGLYIWNPNPGEMAYRLTYKLGEDASVAGPFSGGGTVAYSEESATLVPAAQWYHLEAYLKPADDYTGRITVRLNGSQIFDWNNVIVLPGASGYSNPWHITNYGRNLKNGPTIGDGTATIDIYNDDETIAENGWVYGSSVAPWS